MTHQTEPMETMTKVKAVAVTAKCHPKLHQPKDGVSSKGHSQIKWVFMGTYLVKNECVVVVKAGISRNEVESKVNGNGTGGVFAEGKDGEYCEITLVGSDQDRWSISVATDKDKLDELIFRGGTGRREK